MIATGKTYSIRDFLKLVFEQLELDWQKYVEIDPRYYRPAEVDLLLGDASKAQKLLGLDTSNVVGRTCRIDGGQRSKVGESRASR